MGLSKSKRKMLGVLSIWPLIYIVIFTILIFSISGFRPFTFSSQNNIFLIVFIPVMIVHVLTIVCGLGLMIYFIIHAVKSTKLTQEMKIIWIILLVMFYTIVSPIYWYVNIWKEKPAVQ
jgi:hypothetical protein